LWSWVPRKNVETKKKKQERLLFFIFPAGDRFVTKTSLRATSWSRRTRMRVSAAAAVVLLSFFCCSSAALLFAAANGYQRTLETGSNCWWMELMGQPAAMHASFFLLSLFRLFPVLADRGMVRAAEAKARALDRGSGCNLYLSQEENKRDNAGGEEEAFWASLALKPPRRTFPSAPTLRLRSSPQFRWRWSGFGSDFCSVGARPGSRRTACGHTSTSPRQCLPDSMHTPT
jgi:hypothetical protein